MEQLSFLQTAFAELSESGPSPKVVWLPKTLHISQKKFPLPSLVWYVFIQDGEWQ